MKSIILASASPRRKKLLEQINLTFRVHPSGVSESYPPDWSPSRIVQKLAFRKAEDIAANYQNALVIGADTIVTFRDKVLEKPEDTEDARRMLKMLSGATHQVYSGVALCKTDSGNNIIDSVTFSEKTDVFFGELDSEMIDRYIQTGSPMDKAGGYGIQDDFGAIFVKRIEGDYYNVVGFPLHSFYTTLKSFDKDLLPNIGSAKPSQ